MNDFFKETLDGCVGKTYINSIPLSEFSSTKEIGEVVVYAQKKGLGVAMKVEHSNFYQGVLVEIYDKKTCAFKDYLHK